MAITLNQIAEICGVSRGTVDRALHNKGNVRPAVAERIKAVANEYGYTPNRAGLALSRTSHPIRIGVIMFSVQTPFMQIVLDAARREARRLAAFSVEVIFRLSPSLDPVEQVSMIENLVEQHHISALVDSGRARGVHLIMHDEIPANLYELRRGVADFVIGQDAVQQGALPLSLLADYIQLKQQPQKEFYHTDIRVLLRHNIENLL